MVYTDFFLLFCTSVFKLQEKKVFFFYFFLLVSFFAVADLVGGGGAGDPGLPLILGEKKKED